MTSPRVIARNTLYNGMGRVWEAVISLLLVAYIVARIGLDAYGLWGVVAAFTGFAALLDVGVASAYAKYIAEHEARNDRDAISGIVSTGFFFYLLFGTLFIAITWPGVDLLISLAQRIPTQAAGDFARPELLADLRFLLRGTLILFAFTNCVAPFTAVQTGLQRMGITNILSVVSALIKVAATVFFIESGYGVRGLLFANGFVMAVFAMASVGIALHLVPGLRISVKRATWSTFRPLFRFGWRTQVARLSNLITFETDVLVIAIVVRDFQVVGLYRIGVELANKMRQAPTVLLSAIIPAASALDAHEDQERLSLLYLRGSKYLAAVTFPLVAFLGGAAALCLHVWIDPSEGLQTAAIVTQIFCIAYLANILPGAGVNIALGMGRPDLQMKAGMISMISNIALTLILWSLIGFWGIPIATACSMFLSWAWFSMAMKSTLGIGPRVLFGKALLWSAVAAIPGFALSGVVNWAVADFESRALLGAILAALFLVNIALYVVLIRLTPHFDSYDRAFFSDTFGPRRLQQFFHRPSTSSIESPQSNS